ncbi:MerR family transcriptional regulator [Marivita sp.]|jgi:DNA-binding transcriptional MerR regulator|uniref:MerR family transcriptional regulator n=1 Tax=Marivita sp. TaxID=2003365 RepID=UPI003F6AB2BA
MSKSADAFRTISEVAEWLDTPAHVLRFWESKFTQVKPVKRAGGRRYYRPADMRLLGGIKKLLHDDGMTIKGVQKILREQGIKHVSSLCELSLSDEEEADLALLEDVPASEPLDTVVPFAKPETVEDTPIAEDLPGAAAEAEPEQVDAADDIPDQADTSEPQTPSADLAETEPEPAVEDAILEEEPQAAEAEPEVVLAAEPEPETALPGFLQRSMADRVATEDAVREEADTVQEPVVPVVATPAEPEPSALTYLARIRHLSPEQAQQIAPILDQLKAVAR